MKRVYVAGPYSSGDVIANIDAAQAIGDRIIGMGMSPFIPHLFHYQHLKYPHEYETWMQVDLAWVAVADACLRIPGNSPGADREVQLCRKIGIPVFYAFEDLRDWGVKAA